MNSKKYFDEIAGKWDSIRTEFFSEAVREKALSIAKMKEGKMAADIGAGSGFITEGLINKKMKVIAVDQSGEMLEVMKRKFSGYKNIDYRIGTDKKLPLKNEEADYVFANMYLHHADSPSEAVKEMVRVLKKGGKIIITDADKHDFEFLREEQFDKWLGFEREDVRMWFENAGLKNIVVDCIGEECSCSSEDENEKMSISIFYAYGEK